MDVECCNCNNYFKKYSSSTGKYCSNFCTQESRRKKEIERFLKGEVIARPHLKAHLVRLHGWKCMQCQNTVWEGQPIPLELDHINGDAGNCMPVNVRNLCPNCHALTPTHKARNKGFGRKARGLPAY